LARDDDVESAHFDQEIEQVDSKIGQVLSDFRQVIACTDHLIGFFALVSRVSPRCV
jgi:hypothetical protein